MVEVAEIERLIRDAIPDAQIELNDLRGDGESFEATVASKDFAGLSRVDQHRLVFAALQGRVGATIRTFSLRTIVKD